MDWGGSKSPGEAFAITVHYRHAEGCLHRGRSSPADKRGLCGRHSHMAADSTCSVSDSGTFLVAPTMAEGCTWCTRYHFVQSAIKPAGVSKYASRRSLYSRIMCTWYFHVSEWSRLPLTDRCALSFCRGSTTNANDKRAQGEVSFSKNGQELGVAFDVPADSRAEEFFPAVAFKNAQVSRRCCSLRMRLRGECRRGVH